MIEVEKKFRPTDMQLKMMLEEAEFLGEKILEDFYYDYPDYRLFKNYVYFRNRNGNFELKIGDDEITGISDEIENEKDIKLYFKTKKPLPDFIAENLVPTIHYKTARKKYKKMEFAIDIDELDFGYKCIEIELLVSDKSKVQDAKRKIVEFAQHYNFEIKGVPAKRREYFRLVKPEIYKELYK
ncbi:MAG: hypothetical protein UU82_C0002G0014 [Candidatus Nomurabacteria bacterium GW2011_GWC2_41_8]|uniref:CYTH domain-containing protein n=3 Tax=Candidatus Nomuraibacteriota TaxID=1752729 RepID=A0A1F6YAH9_9BACT|nr:MAG: hypothetical protein UU58_C0002G0018 [Candidatus Nomurabacteria bacterium GW2011_GWA2_41_25]KKS24649.1 MAG: hypothetical protein UU82_C0002G0014 [Candidatus Nomurabacteria bacterium GW2011_GWC2_41_8]OGI66757.1 MAG: hypothetical protein A2823_00625 [Candidatus Nomurabacteria bacterium RIFCSPHIGHO2_01_FULL_41_91]OGI80949.1 MAG: hypothetical protein A3D43_01825 [Candidatus Nomurabacteria bacterium RIFCSPHIGHO2_02_FULL_41_52]OGI84520.1 MAG: hypothetical protein A3F49_02920 [Candidatus Nomur